MISLEVVARQGLMNNYQLFAKRLFDLIAAVIGLVLISWLLIICLIIARFDTGRSGIFRQCRIGKNGKPFDVIKLRTMREVDGWNTTVTTDKDPRITVSGRFFRKTKIDELPQLINILKGEMSFVGPRPDVPGYADKLQGKDRIILTVRPGITGPASLYYHNEEDVLEMHPNPECYNREVIWPHKVAMNREYIEEYSLWKDLVYIFKTIF